MAVVVLGTGISESEENKYGREKVLHVSWSRAAKKLLTVDWKTVGRRIRELRGFETTQAELAEALGIAQSYLSAIERGLKEPSATILFRIARQYGKTIEWMLTGG